MSYPKLDLVRGRRIQLYVLLSVVNPFLGAIAFFMFMFMMFQTLRLADFVIVHRAPLSDVAHICGYLFLSLTPFILPVAFLAAVLLGFGGLAADNEIVALKSCGFSIHRLLTPVLAFSFVVTGVSLYVAFQGAPWAERSMNRTINKIGRTQAANFLKQRAFNTGFFGLMVYVGSVDPVTYDLKSVFILDEREAEFPIVITAREGKIVPVAGPNHVSDQMVMKLYDGIEHRIGKLKDATQVMKFHDYSIFLKGNSGDGGEVLQTRMLTYPELIAERARCVLGSREYKDYSMELWKRFSTSVAPLLFCFLGIGLGTMRRTRASHDRSLGLLLTFVTMIFYWTALTFATQNCTAGNWPAIYALQIPNLGVAVAAFFAYRRAMW